MTSDLTAHLEELRRRLLVALGVVAAASVVSYFFTHAILDFLIRPLEDVPGAQLVFQKPHEAFLIHIKTAFLSGVILTSPFLFLQLWSFVAPGLYEREKKKILPLSLVTTFLFLIGVAFAYGVAVPWGLKFFLSFQTETLRPMLGITPYFSFLAGMLLAFGLLFDFPVLIVGLVEMGVVKTATLARSRKMLIVLIFFAAALMTPSPDPVSQLLLALPLYGLFEISLWVAARRERKRQVSSA